MIIVARRRLAAIAAAISTIAGAIAITVAVVAGPGPGLSGYVSEAGITSSPYAGLYRAGVFGLAGSLLLLAVALPASPGKPPPDQLSTVVRGVARLPLARVVVGLLANARAASGLLAAGAAATAISGAVTCSGGSPYERVTVADLVHGGASITAVASCIFAILVVALVGSDPAARRVSGAAATVALPLSTAVGLAMLTMGRGTAVGLLERLLLADILLWAICLAALLAGPAPHRYSPPYP